MVALAALREGVDSMILEGFSNLNDSMILSPWQFINKSLRQFSTVISQVRTLLVSLQCCQPSSCMPVLRFCLQTSALPLVSHLLAKVLSLMNLFHSQPKNASPGVPNIRHTTTGHYFISQMSACPITHFTGS